MTALRVCLLLITSLGFSTVFPAGSVSHAPVDGEQLAADKTPEPDDRNDEPLPRGSIARIGTTRFRPGTPVDSLVFSPDGKILASVEGASPSRQVKDTCRIHLWQADTGKSIRRLHGPQRLLWRVVFSSDGKFLSALGDSMLCSWDVATGQEVRRFRGPWPDAPNVTLAVSPDGGTLAWRQDSESVIHVWNVATAQEIRRLAGHQRARLIGFSTDGKTLVSGSYHDQTFRCWDMAEGAERCRLPVFQSAATRYQLSPDASFITTWQDDGPIQIWDVANEKEVRRLTPGDGIECVAVSADRKIAAAGMFNGVVQLWEVDTGKLLHEIRAHPLHVGCLAFSPDGRVLDSSGRFDYTIRQWDVATGRELQPTGSHRAQIASLGISSDGKCLVTASPDRTARFWDLASGKELRQFDLGYDEPAVALSPDGKTLATGGRRLLDALTGAELRRFAGDKMYGFSRLTFSPDGTKLIGSGSGELNCLWDVATGKVVREFRGTEIWSSAFSADGRTLAVGLEEGIQFWDLATDKRVGEVAGRPRPTAYCSGYCQLAFSPDGRLLAAALRRNGSSNRQPPKEGGIRVFDVATGEVRFTLDGDKGYVLAVAFSPDGRLLASGGADHTVRFWDTATGKERHPFQGHWGPVTSLVFTPDGKAIVSSATDATALVWDVTKIGP